MIEPSALAFEWLAAGGLVTIAGVLVKFRGWTSLLAGYDTTSPVPDGVVQDVAGNTVLRIGIAVFALGLLASVTDVPSYLNTATELSPKACLKNASVSRSQNGGSLLAACTG